MPTTARNSRTGGTEGGAEGVVAGAVLAAVRRQLGYAHPRMAELVGADVDTLRSWEAGRRPLTRVGVYRFRDVVAALRRAGADPAALQQLDTAVDVDLDMGRILSFSADLDEHPLAAMVRTRTWHDLFGWALGGSPPAVFADASRPRLSPAARSAVIAQLREAADRSMGRDDMASTLLRRQVYFVVSRDVTQDCREWLDRMERWELRSVRARDDWTPAWAVRRSLAVARAVAGDPERLRHFIADQMGSDRAEIANLRYWAYWVGEDGTPAVSDAFMADGDLGPWRGDTLLRHLVAGLAAGVSYRDLVIHSVWALVGRRPWLLDDDPPVTAALDGRCRRLLDDHETLGVQARRELEQLAYAVRTRGRPR